MRNKREAAANTTLEELRKKYPEGIPKWMLERGYSPVHIDELMKLRRQAFPNIVKGGKK